MSIESINTAFEAATEFHFASADPEQVMTPPPLEDFVVSIDDLISMDIPEPEMIIDPFLSRGSLAMVYAKRGVGKTWFLLELSLALARGSSLFQWKVPAPQKVLYVDGEMSLSELRQRLIRLTKGGVPAGLQILPSESLSKAYQTLNINAAPDQERINLMLEKVQPDVLILDNLSSLCVGRDENSNSEVDSILQWLRYLRHQGIAVIIVHHAGKTNDQRGASRLEDILDTSIRLTEQSGISDGASFKIEFTKTRGPKPKPYTLVASLEDTGEGLEWVFSKTKPIPNKFLILKHIHDGKAKYQKELVVLMDKDKSLISRTVNNLKDKKLLKNQQVLCLTAKGEQELQLMSIPEGEAP